MAKIMAAAGEIVAIGTLDTIFSPRIPYRMPKMPFIVVKGDDNDLVATCLYLMTDGRGKTVQDAIRSMIDGCLQMLYAICAKGDDFAQDALRDLFATTDEENWRAYRMAQAELIKDTSQQDVVKQEDDSGKDMKVADYERIWEDAA